MKIKVLILLMICLTTLLGCGPAVKESDLEFVVEKYTMLHNDVKRPSHGSIKDCYDYILLPYKLETNGGQYDYFKDEYAINITWEVVNGNLSLETLDESNLGNFKTAEILKKQVYGELYYSNDNNEVNAFKITYTNEVPITMVRATYSCGDISITRVYEIEVIVSAVNKYLMDKDYEYNSISKGWYKDNGGTFIANGSTLYRYTSLVSFSTNTVTTTYRHLSGVSNVHNYTFMYNSSNKTITVKDTLNSFEYNIFEIAEPYKVYSYQLEYFEKAYNEFIDMLKVYDEVQIMFYNGENVTPYYQNQTYPGLSNFVTSGK